MSQQKTLKKKTYTPCSYLLYLLLILPPFSLPPLFLPPLPLFPLLPLVLPPSSILKLPTSSSSFSFMSTSSLLLPSALILLPPPPSHIFFPSSLLSLPSALNPPLSSSYISFVLILLNFLLNVKKTFKKANNTALYIHLDIFKLVKDLFVSQTSLPSKKKLKKASKMINIFYKSAKHPTRSFQIGNYLKFLFLLDCLPLNPTLFILLLLLRGGGQKKWLKLFGRLSKRGNTGGILKLVLKVRKFLEV